MDQTPVIELERLGRDAANGFAGLGTIENVHVITGEDTSGGPAYYFQFVIGDRRDHQHTGLLRTRLAQKLRDELVARNDVHYPYIQIFSPVEWNARLND